MHAYKNTVMLLKYRGDPVSLPRGDAYEQIITYKNCEIE